MLIALSFTTTIKMILQNKELRTLKSKATQTLRLQKYRSTMNSSNLCISISKQNINTVLHNPSVLIFGPTQKQQSYKLIWKYAISTPIRGLFHAIDPAWELLNNTIQAAPRVENWIFIGNRTLCVHQSHENNVHGAKLGNRDGDEEDAIANTT